MTDVEMESFLAPPTNGSSRPLGTALPIVTLPPRPPKKVHLRVRMAAILAGAIAGGIGGRSLRLATRPDERVDIMEGWETSLKELRPEDVLYQCPSRTVNPDGGNADEPEVYAEGNAKILADLSDYAEHYKTRVFDGWGKTFKQVKNGMGPWKREHFKEVTSGSSIYESAFGIGLNLLMTAQILRDDYGVSNLTLYGNEYMEDSVRIAHGMYAHGVFPKSTRIGQLCPADSRDLGFVPSNVFDVVYSGYITPLQDPLKQGDDWYVWTKDELCEGKVPEHEQLVVKMQSIQEDWYSTWVQEMIRIAKPGAPVMVEQVSYPLCDVSSDWGGVPQDFWHKGANLLGWEIDPNSISFADDTIQSNPRYHVFMRKLG
jgi:hypothetical protein